MLELVVATSFSGNCSGVVEAVEVAVVVVEVAVVVVAVLVDCVDSEFGTAGLETLGRLFFSSTNCKSSANSIASMAYPLISEKSDDSFIDIRSALI